jgi:HEAT repeat protein
MNEHTLPSRFGRSSACLLWPALLLVPFAVHADDVALAVVYDRERGELSVGTEAPEPERMANAIRSASPTALTAMLEYGERVECLECIPLLEAKLLGSDSPKVREMAAWWLRRRPFGYGRAAVAMRQVATQDSDPVRRSRAVEALGEFLDVRGLPALEQAALRDEESSVRLSAVRALGRLNARGGRAVLAAAFADEDASVRRAALDQVLRINHFGDDAALIAALSDTDANVRLRAAQLSGERRIVDATAALAGVLGDDSAPVRQAAAWALGRIGGEQAKQALRAAADAEREPGVQDAIGIALRM